MRTARTLTSASLLSALAACHQARKPACQLPAPVQKVHSAACDRSVVAASCDRSSDDPSFGRFVGVRVAELELLRVDGAVCAGADCPWKRRDQLRAGVASRKTHALRAQPQLQRCDALRARAKQQAAL